MPLARRSVNASAADHLGDRLDAGQAAHERTVEIEGDEAHGIRRR
jgi:ubiquinone biosynthesis protein UbiJ